DGLDVGGGVAEPGEVAEVVLAAVLGAQHQRVALLGEVVDGDHASAGAGVAEPQRRVVDGRAGGGDALQDRLDRDVHEVGVGQPGGGGAGAGVVDVHLLGVAGRPRGRAHVLGAARAGGGRERERPGAA